MIKFKEKEYEAPFEPSKIAKKNLKKANSIFNTTTESAFSKLNSNIAEDNGRFPLRPEESFRPTKPTPVYIQELALSKFIEEYLDFFVPKLYEHYNAYVEVNEKSVTPAIKVLNDILMILETDRLIIKTYNGLVANEINPVREKIAVHLKSDDAHQVTSRFDKEMKVTM